MILGYAIVVACYVAIAIAVVRAVAEEVRDPLWRDPPTDRRKP